MDGTGPYDKVQRNNELLRTQEIARAKGAKRKQQDPERNRDHPPQDSKDDDTEQHFPVDKIELSVDAQSVNLTDIRYLAEHLLRQMRLSEENGNKADMQTDCLPQNKEISHELSSLYSKATRVYESHIDDSESLNDAASEAQFHDRSGFLELNCSELNEMINIIQHLKAIGQTHVSVNPEQTYFERLRQLDRALNRSID